MTPSDIIQENPGSHRSTGPGDRLQAARIEQDLSIEDVATRMHLSIGILKAIEVNNFDEVTAPIFVKGYLRAYARIVSLDEDEIIQQYLDYYSDEDPPINSTSNLASEISSDDARVKWTTYLVIVGLLGLLAVWWWNQYQIKTDVVSLDAEQTDSMQQPEIASDTVVSETVTEPEPSSAAEEVAVLSMPVDEPEVTGSSVVAETQEEVALEQAEPEVVEVVQQEIAQQEPEASNIEVLPEEISPISPIGSDQLKIIIHADTWIDIEDANGRSLIRELIRADQELHLIGKAPFIVFLGNGHGVELIYDNETIDISGRIRDNNTARLKIGS
jgi:cytoskeleton protein RodZ